MEQLCGLLRHRQHLRLFFSTDIRLGTPLTKPFSNQILRQLVNLLAGWVNLHQRGILQSPIHLNRPLLLDGTVTRLGSPRGANVVAGGKYLRHILFGVFRIGHSPQFPHAIPSTELTVKLMDDNPGLGERLRGTVNHVQHAFLTLFVHLLKLAKGYLPGRWPAAKGILILNAQVAHALNKLQHRQRLIRIHAQHNRLQYLRQILCTAKVVNLARSAILPELVQHVVVYPAAKRQFGIDPPIHAIHHAPQHP